MIVTWGEKTFWQILLTRSDKLLALVKLLWKKQEGVTPGGISVEGEVVPAVVVVVVDPTIVVDVLPVTVDELDLVDVEVVLTVDEDDEVVTPLDVAVLVEVPSAWLRVE